ncbi:conserved hypothetical protein [Hyphomicrobiales bacterium]|nr:conserved hypothetical protein [Hyphomicrobiales bacterium]CAH1702926.1 conserved hypothetical protein [Hyphomicrobiales bacterium]CAI0347112.1 conserved hypothetical protein [Hyphomicrobiales bacterium]
MAKIVAWADHRSAVFGRRKRARQERWQFMRSSTPVEIPVAEGNPIKALELQYERHTGEWGKSPKQTVSITLEGLDGALRRAMRLQDQRPVTPDLLHDPNAWRFEKFWPFEKPVDLKGDILPDEAVAIAQMADISRDGREWQQARAVRVASDLMMREGNLWKRDPEPVWRVEMVAGRGVVDYGRANTTKTGAFIFRIDQQAAANDLAKQLTLKGRPKLNSMRLAHVDPAYLTVPEAGATLETAAMALRSNLRRLMSHKKVAEELKPFEQSLVSAWASGDTADVIAALQTLLRVYDGVYDPRYDERNAHSPSEALCSWSVLLQIGLEANLIPSALPGETTIGRLDEVADDGLAELGMDL